MKRERSARIAQETYRRLLLAKKADVLQDFAADGMDLAAQGHVALEDEAPILHEHFVALRVKQLDHQTLRHINAALERLAAGEFGVCTSCGDPISPKRLQAIPWAQCCIACQERAASAGLAAGYHTAHAEGGRARVHPPG